jgi:26S proteasome regulatory subunit N11
LGHHIRFHGHSDFSTRAEIVVGWYHSHPGFGCWLSSVDVQTQQVRIILLHLFQSLIAA